MENITSPYSFKLFNFELITPTVEEEIPEARGGQKSTCTLKSLYIYGGYNPEAPSGDYHELWEFNLNTKQWRTLKVGDHVPSAVVSSSIARRKDKLIVFGGTAVPFAFKCSNKLYTIKLDDKLQFHSLTIRGTAPTPRYGQSIVMQKSFLYVIGGTDGFTYDCNIYRVNLNKNPRVWKTVYTKKGENVSYEPEGRYKHESAFDGENIYVIGGGTALKSYNLDVIPTFNLKSKKWQKLYAKGDVKSFPEYPEARRCHSMVQVKAGNKINVYILGGYQNNECGFNDLWKLELPSLQWTLVKKQVLSHPLYYHSMSLTKEGKVYVFGGIEGGAALKRSNQLYMAWIRIPKLAEIAWEAVLHYFPEFVQNYAKYNIELPSNFLSRI